MSREQQAPPPRRFIAIPFSSGCRSHSSVDVVDTARHAGNGKKPHSQGVETGAMPGGTSVRPPLAPAAAAGSKGESLVARLLRGFKNLSQIFAVYDEDEDEEEEREMVIGLPTDVKHVAHIGWDGSTSTTTSLRSWNRAAPPAPAPASCSSSSSSSSAPIAVAAPQKQQQTQEQYPLPLPALSMRQFELAMAAQAAAGAATTTSGGGAAHRRHS